MSDHLPHAREHRGVPHTDAVTAISRSRAALIVRRVTDSTSCSTWVNATSRPSSAVAFVLGVVWGVAGQLKPDRQDGDVVGLQDVLRGEVVL